MTFRAKLADLGANLALIWTQLNPNIAHLGRNFARNFDSILGQAIAKAAPTPDPGLNYMMENPFGTKV